MASKPELCLRWHSYENSLLMSVSDMWDAGVMTDITLSAEGRTIHAHQVVLSSSSGYFKEILQDITPAQHPIVVLPFACFADLHVAVQFMYKGEVNLTQAELPGLLRMAEVLRVKGLAKLNPSKASGLLRKAYQTQKQDETEDISTAKIPDIKVEPEIWNTANSSLSYGEDEEAVEITEIAEQDNESNVPMDEDCDEEQSNCGNSDRGAESGSEQSEGKLYFLTSLGQHEEQHSSNEKKVKKVLHQTQPSTRKTSTGGKKRSRTKRSRGTKGSSMDRGTSRSGGDLLRALSAAWEKERNNGRATIRKTLLPVSCPVCFKVLSNAYNLKVHMSIHDGLNHQCSICGHTSKSRDALRKHLAYRHLIGQSGPVRPRLPANKRRRLNQVTGQEEDYDDGDGEGDAAADSGGNVSATPINLSDLDAEMLLQCEEADEGDEEAEDSEADHGQLNRC